MKALLLLVILGLAAGGLAAWAAWEWTRAIVAIVDQLEATR